MALARRSAVPLGMVAGVAALLVLVLAVRSEPDHARHAAPVKPPDVRVARSKLGRILVDARGRTLYLFLEDADGRSACYGGCARVWPPALASAHPKAGAGVKARQLVYDHHPLYTTVADVRPGQTAGQGYFGTWFVVSPSGDLIGHPKKTAGY
jgi:predicted lipoprotein with Yx(FWY)xxD motif